MYQNAEHYLQELEPALNCAFPLPITYRCLIVEEWRVWTWPRNREELPLWAMQGHGLHMCGRRSSRGSVRASWLLKGEYAVEWVAFTGAFGFAARQSEISSTSPAVLFLGRPGSTTGHFFPFKACQLSYIHSWSNQVSSLTSLGSGTLLLGIQQLWTLHSYPGFQIL